MSPTTPGPGKNHESTGARCWADPESDTICVILTTLPARAVHPHPRDLASDRVAEAVR